MPFWDVSPRFIEVNQQCVLLQQLPYFVWVTIDTELQPNLINHDKGNLKPRILLKTKQRP